MKVQYQSGEWGGSYDANIYSNPQNCGLKIVASVEEEPDYSFHIIALWRDKKTGSLWLGSDSGCSCPSPFEDTRSFSDLTRIQSEYGLDKFMKESYINARPNEVRDFRRKVRAEIRAWKKKREAKKS